ncbi:putative DNA-binding domain-containing protein [Sandaracinus amylolyticus]|uniref:Uncharacterized protein n=1 Tax=Sandaracinus amylolyticus TaxID=927083 RepID=A0A0F6YNG5_9BACT|nr:putative DNA-binding domain-containing protein [Sandaracinus amylolyticus]AKF10410.1 hypothetical protein DB32_007559 [Sandaracinus amylolyticus]
MTVADLQRAMQRVCFDAAPSREDLALVGSERALLYRELVRSRLRELVSKVLPKTEAALGRARTSALFDAFLAEAPPRSRFFREVIPELVAFALPRVEGHARDVLLLESTRWELAWRAGEVHGDVVELDLEKIPVAHPTLRVLALGHAVHRDVEPPPAGAFFVCVHRRPDHVVETRTLDATSFALVRAWARGDRPAIDGVREVLAAEGRAPDQAFVEKMSALLTALLEAGALLGSRA